MGSKIKARVRSIILNLFCLMLSLVFLIGALEFSIRIFFPQPVNIRGTRFSNTLVYENVPGASFVYKTSEFEAEIVFNSEGFRDEEFEVEKSAFRIAILGDSYGEGMQIPIKKVFHNQLEVFLNKDRGPIEVMNFSVSGYGTDQELILLKNKVIKFSPDLVIVLYCHNDIQDVLTMNLIRSKEGKLVYRMHNPNPLWKNFKAFVRNLHCYYFVSRRVAQLPVLTRTLDRIKLLTFELFGEEFTVKYFPQVAHEAKKLKDRAGVSVELQAFLQPPSDKVRKLWNLEFKILSEMQNILKTIDAQLTIVISTKDIQLNKEALRETLEKFQIDESQFILNMPNNNLVRFAKSQNIPILDLLPAFKGRADRGEVLHFAKDGHWNQLGHYAAALETYKFLIRNDLIIMTESTAGE